MTKDQDIERIIREEFNNNLSVLVWQNKAGDYEAFGKYRIIPQQPGYTVYVNDDIQGFFNSTRTAISWCIADKYQRYNLARDLLMFDNMFATVSNDIFVRAGVASKCRDSQLKETIEIKLEPKIIQKRILKEQIDKCVNWAKYLHQKGFENETSRPGTATKVKANISRV